MSAAPTRRILGISAFYHDSAAALVVDGEIVAAAQEERFTRKKHDPGFPAKAVAYCLREGGLTAGQLDAVVFYDKPMLKFERLLETYLGTAPLGLSSFMEAMPQWLSKKLRLPGIIRDALVGYKGDIYFTEHHESHAASAYFPSPFDHAAVLTMDGVGEWTTTSWGVGNGSKLELRQEVRFPHSVGLLYSAFTYYTGFKVNSGEYKVMGLAPYGEPKFVDVILKDLMDLKEDGSFKMNLDYFTYTHGLRMTGGPFAKLLGGPARAPESKLTQREMDLARSIQVVVEEVMIRQAKHVHKTTGLKNLCMAGGVALNCVANGKLLREGPFENIWIQPAAGDAGGALGAALAFWYSLPGATRTAVPGDAMRGSYLGPEFTEAETRTELEASGAVFHRLADDEMIERVAQALADEKVVGWVQGRMEFGPRALGGRSILGDARSAETQKTMNVKIKFRESFRPFAPSVLREHVADYFELDGDSPYMLLVADVQKARRKAMSAADDAKWGIDKLNVMRSDIPAVTHVDYSARVQTVHRETNPRYHKLLESFKAKTGCAVVVNTSFNVRGEPIVCSPSDAYRCFMRSNIDVLVCWPFLMEKSEQPHREESLDWQKEFVLD